MGQLVGFLLHPHFLKLPKIRKNVEIHPHFQSAFGTAVWRERERGSVRGEREIEIECVHNDRNVFMSRDRERERECL